MNKMVKFPLILAITGVVCAGALGVVYQVANPIIEERVNAAANEAIGAVLPGAKGSDITKNYKDKADLMKKYNVSTIYEVTKDGKKIGNGYKLSGTGRNGAIEMMVILNDEKILGVKVLSQSETSSFYDKVTGAHYEESFKDVSSDSLDGFDTVAGATLSSKGIKGAVIAARDAHKEIVLGETVGPKEIVTQAEFDKLGYSGETFELATEKLKSTLGESKYNDKLVKNGITDAFYRKNSAGEIVGYVYYFNPTYNCEVSNHQRADQSYRGLYSFDKDGGNAKLVILESGDSLSMIGKPSLQDMAIIEMLQGFNINDVKSQLVTLPGKDKYAGATFTGQNMVLVVSMICVNHKNF